MREALQQQTGGFGLAHSGAHLAGFGFGILFALVSRGAVERRLRRQSY